MESRLPATFYSQCTLCLHIPKEKGLFWRDALYYLIYCQVMPQGFALSSNDFQWVSTENLNYSNILGLFGFSIATHLRTKPAHSQLPGCLGLDWKQKQIGCRLSNKHTNKVRSCCIVCINKQSIFCFFTILYYYTLEYHIPNTTESIHVWCQ